jgi:putative oxidoreductase
MVSLFAKTVLNPLLLRVALAVVFIFHGMNLVGGPEKDWGTNWMPDGSQPPHVQAAVAWGELLGGIALGVGFLTRLAATGIIAIMVGAIATIHWENGFDIAKGGYEYNVVIITMCLCLVLGGAGPLAVDRIFRVRRYRDR